MKYKGFIFDCDGTLVDSEHLHVLAWKKCLEKRGFTLTQEKYMSLAGHSLEYIAHHLYTLIQTASPEILRKEKTEIYQVLQEEREVIPIEPTVQFVRALVKEKEALGIRLGVASAGLKNEILANLTKAGLKELFDVIISGTDDLHHYKDPEGVNKPKPYVYLHCVECLGLHPSECIAFEDTQIGVTSATTAGLFTVAIPNEFTKHHDFSLASLVLRPPFTLDIHTFLQGLSS